MAALPVLAVTFAVSMARASPQTTDVEKPKPSEASAAPRAEPTPAAQNARKGYAPPPNTVVQTQDDNPPGFPAHGATRPVRRSQEDERKSYHTHDGIFFRTYLGIGYTKMSGDGTSISGGGGACSLALGGTINPHLVFFGEIFDSVASNPSIYDDNSGIPSHGSAGLVGVGPGFAYFSDDEVYFSGTFALSKLAASDSDGHTIAATDFGMSFSSLLGKQAWISDNWAMGGAIQLFFGALPTRGGILSPTWTTLGFNVVVTIMSN